MNKSILISAIVILISGCSEHRQLSGTYKSEVPGRVQKLFNYYFKGYTTYAVGSELTLESDSDFILTTCAHIAEGNWYRLKDSVFLHYESKRWRNDSIQQHGYEGQWPSLPQKPIACKINRNRLLLTFASNHNSKTSVTIVILKKMESE